MQARSDIQLLREYAREGSEAAFEEIVARYTDLVYSVVLTQVGSTALAEDVTQEVFTDLARKARALAGSMDESGTIVGWLYRSCRYAVSNHRRAEQRRQNRERQAMQDFDSTPITPPDWERIRPLLDEALADLSEDDRQAMLLRFFQNRGFQAVGAALGISEDTAQKRVARALEKLRAHLAGHGITTSSAMLSGVLSSNAIHTAPAGMAAKIAGASLAGAKSSIVTTLLVMTTSSKIAVTVAGIAAALALWLAVQHRSPASQPQTNTAMQEAAPPSRIKPEELQKATEQALMMMGTACRLYANDHPGLYPTSTDQIQELLHLDRGEFSPGVVLDKFEFIDYGSHGLSDAFPQSLRAREKLPRRMPDGKWHRAYLLADGSALEAASTDGKFDAWEKDPDHRAGYPDNFKP